MNYDSKCTRQFTIIEYYAFNMHRRFYNQRDGVSKFFFSKINKSLPSKKNNESYQRLQECSKILMKLNVIRFVRHLISIFPL